MQTPTPNPADRVTLTRVGTVELLDDGRAYIAAHFKAGPFGRAIRRAFWADKADDGTLNWSRATPDELKALEGQDVTGMAEVHAVDIEPKEVTSKRTGEVITLTTVSVVRFADETLASACRVYGSTPRQPKAEPLAPAGFHVVGGDGAVV